MTSRRKWTEKEEKKLISLVGDIRNIKEISQKLNRTERAIKHRLEKMRKERKDIPYFRKYTEEEMDLLRSFSHDPEIDTPKSIGNYLGKTEHSVNAKLYRLRKEENFVNLIQRRWEKWEDEMLIHSNGKLTHEELAKKLNRSKSAITHRRIILGIARKRIDLSVVGKDIRNLASKGYTRKEISEKLSLNYKQVQGYLYRNNITCKESSREKTSEQKQEHNNFMKHATRRY